MKLIRLLFVLCAFPVFAQPFQPDANGYVKDPAFRSFIEKRGYSLVSAFDSVEGKTGRYAAVFRGDSLYLLDVQGNELQYAPNPKERLREEARRDVPTPPYQITTEGGKQVILHPDGSTFPVPYHTEIKLLKGAAQFPQSAFAYKVGDLWGLLSDKGAITLEPSYLAIRDNDAVTETLTILHDSKLGIIDRNGKIILEPVLEGAVHRRWTSTYGKLQSKSHGLVDLRTGNTICSCHVSEEQRYGKDLFQSASGDATTKNCYGLFNLRTGKEVFPPQYAQFPIESKTDRFVISQYVGDKLKNGIADTNGKILIPIVHDKLDQRFLDGRGICVDAGRYGLLGLDNTFILPQEYAFLTEVYFSPKQKSSLVIFEKNGLCGLMDIRQKIIIPPLKGRLTAFQTGVRVITSEGAGFYSFTGEVIIAPGTYQHFDESGIAGIFNVTLEKFSSERYKADMYGHVVPIGLPGGQER